MARLDRLGRAKEIVQLGATLGREFDHALLQAVSPLNEEALQQGLRQLATVHKEV
jgi:predicted ATPase